MTVWCVFRDYDYEGEALRAICSTRELADAFVERMVREAEGRASDWIIDEWEIDSAIGGLPLAGDAPEGRQRT